MIKFECSRVKTLTESELEQVVGGGLVEKVEQHICETLTGDHEHCGGCGSKPHALHEAADGYNNHHEHGGGSSHDWTHGCGSRHEHKDHYHRDHEHR